MPLLVITGYPASGKSTITARIVKDLEARGQNVHVLRDIDANSEYVKSPSLYNSKRILADHNNALRSEALRLLNSRSNLFLVVDSMNYARSQRYELFTVAKNCRTTFGIVFCDADRPTSSFLNDSSDAPYPSDLLDDLIARYERPNARLSGEKPLFEIQVRNSDDEDLIALPATVPLPLDEIYSWFVLSRPMKQNASVTAPTKTATSFIQEVDTITQKVVKTIMDQQKLAGPGGTVTFDWEPDVKFRVRRLLSYPALLRLRTQFLDMSRKNLVEPGSSVTKLFVEYLSSTCL